MTPCTQTSPRAANHDTVVSVTWRNRRTCLARRALQQISNHLVRTMRVLVLEGHGHFALRNFEGSFVARAIPAPEQLG